MLRCNFLGGFMLKKQGSDNRRNKPPNGLRQKVAGKCSRRQRRIKRTGIAIASLGMWKRPLLAVTALSASARPLAERSRWPAAGCTWPVVVHVTTAPLLIVCRARSSRGRVQRFVRVWQERLHPQAGQTYPPSQYGKTSMCSAISQNNYI